MTRTSSIDPQAINAVRRLIVVAEEHSTSGHPNHDREVLRRAGAHAMGCSLYDLRDSELDWLDAMVAEAIA